MSMIVNPYRFGAGTIDGTLGSTDAGILAAVLFTVSGGVVTVVGQKNVASVSQLTAGVYRITYTSALANTNYGMILGARRPSSADDRPGLAQPNRNTSVGANYSTTSVDIMTEIVSPTIAGFEPTHCMAVVYDPSAVSASNYLAAASWTVSGTTVTLQRQTNVASMSRSAAGAYRVNYSSALADADYAEWVMSRYADFTNYAIPLAGQNRHTSRNLHSTASLDLCTGIINGGSTNYDTGRGSVLVGNADVAPRGTIARARFTVSGGVVTIVDQYNIASISRTAAGEFRVTFATPCVDANYGVACSGKWAGATSDDAPAIGPNSNSDGNNRYTANDLDITAMGSAGFHGDPDAVNLWVLKPWLM